MSLFLRITVITLFALVALGAAGLWGLHEYIESDSTRERLTRGLSDSLEREIRIDGNLQLAPGWPPRLRATNLRIANAEWAQEPYFARVEEVVIAPQLWPLLGGRLVLELVEVRNGQLWLEANDQGQGNWPDPGSRDDGEDGGSSGFKLEAIASANISNFEISRPQDEQAPRLLIDNLDAEESLGETKVNVNAHLGDRPLIAQWTASNTLWFLNDDDSETLSLEIELDGNDVSGELTIDRSVQPPRLSGQLQSEAIVFKDDPGEDNDNDPLIPDHRLRSKWLDTLQADIQWDIKKLTLGAVVLSDLRTTASLSNGELKLDPLDAKIGTAALHLRAKLARVDDLTSLRVSGELDDLNLRENIDWLKTSSPGAGYVDIRFLAEGVGQSTADIAANLNGDLQLVMEAGEVSNAWLEKVTSDLATLITPWSDVEGQTPVRCLALRMQAEDGLVNIEQLVLDTRAALIVGDGSINLRDSTIDVTLSPDSYSVDLLKLQIPINISGPLRSPDADPSPTALITVSGFNILQEIVSAGGLLEQDLEGPISGSGAGCQATLEAYREQDGESESDSDGEAGKTTDPSP